MAKLVMFYLYRKFLPDVFIEHFRNFEKRQSTAFSLLFPIFLSAQVWAGDFFLEN